MDKFQLAKYLEHSSHAINKFTCGKGDAKSRLIESEQELIFLINWHLPEELQKDQLKIKKSLTKKPEFIIEGSSHRISSIVKTVEKMRNETASKIIRSILNLHCYVEGYKERFNSP